MKKLKFASHLIDMILTGEKTSTWRLFDDKDLQEGDKLEFINRDNGEKFTEAEIVRIDIKKLGEIEEGDYEGHEKFADKEAMLNAYKGYYGDNVSFDTEVKIIRFKKI